MNFLSLFLDKSFFKKALTLALPIALQNLISSSLNLIDNIIIGGMGEVAIASVGLANQYFFLLNLVLFGTISGASIFTAQYWGKKDLKNIKRVLGLTLITVFIASTIFMLGGLIVPKLIIGLFSKDPRVILMGSEYLKIIALSYILTGLSFTYSMTLRSIGHVKPPMIVSIIALCINTILNFILVYGIGNFHGIGVEGSAIATLIARIIEFTMIISIVYKYNYPIAGKVIELFDISLNFIKKFFKVTTPVILNESIWALGITAYSVIYAHMGTKVIASTNIVSTIDNLAMVVFWGFCNAAAIMIGTKIGEKKEDEAFLYAKRFIILNTLLGIFIGILIYLFAPHILSFYKVSPLVRIYSKDILHVIGIFLWIKVFNHTNVIGILRSGGDTKFCLFMDISGMWLVGVPIVAFTGLYLHMPIQQVYLFVFIEEIIKFSVGLPRIISKKWINNLVVH